MTRHCYGSTLGLQRWRSILTERLSRKTGGWQVRKSQFEQTILKTWVTLRATIHYLKCSETSQLGTISEMKLFRGHGNCWPVQNGSEWILKNFTLRFIQKIRNQRKCGWRPALLKTTFTKSKTTSGILGKVHVVRTQKFSTIAAKNSTTLLKMILKIIRAAKTNATLKSGTLSFQNTTTSRMAHTNRFRIKTLIRGWGLNGLFPFSNMRRPTLKLTCLCRSLMQRRKCQLASNTAITPTTTFHSRSLRTTRGQLHLPLGMVHCHQTKAAAMLSAGWFGALNSTGKS